MQFIEQNMDLFIKILKAFLVFAGGYIFIVILNNFVLEKVRDWRKFDTGTANFVFRILKIVEWFVVAVVILSVFEINLAPFLASLGIAGAIIGLALKDVFSNFASGIMIMVYKPFHVGDYIQVGKEIKGTVRDIGISALEIKTFTNEKIVVPNSSVWGNAIVNFTAYSTRMIKFEVNIPYKASLDKAIKIILEILKKDKRVLDEPEYKAIVYKMSDSAMVISVRGWTKKSDYWHTRFDLIKIIKEKLAKSSINIPFNQMDVHVKKN